MPRAAGCGYAQPGLSDRSRGLPQDWLTVASGLLWDQHPHRAVPSYTTGVTGLAARSAGTTRARGAGDHPKPRLAHRWGRTLPCHRHLPSTRADRPRAPRHSVGLDGPTVYERSAPGKCSVSRRQRPPGIGSGLLCLGRIEVLSCVAALTEAFIDGFVEVLDHAAKLRADRVLDRHVRSVAAGSSQSLDQEKCLASHSVHVIGVGESPIEVLRSQGTLRCFEPFRRTLHQYRGGWPQVVGGDPFELVPADEELDSVRPPPRPKPYRGPYQRSDSRGPATAV
jgi:hypothetical protein